MLKKKIFTEDYNSLRSEKNDHYEYHLCRNQKNKKFYDVYVFNSDIELKKQQIRELINLNNLD